MLKTIELEYMTFDSIVFDMLFYIHHRFLDKVIIVHLKHMLGNERWYRLDLKKLLSVFDDR